jgi:hypothetical protein
MARLVPLTADGFIYASSMVIFDSAAKEPVSGLARRLLGPGIAASLAANVAQAPGDGLGLSLDSAAYRERAKAEQDRAANAEHHADQLSPVGELGGQVPGQVEREDGTGGVEKAV